MAGLVAAGTMPGLAAALLLVTAGLMAIAAAAAGATKEFAEAVRMPAIKAQMSASEAVACLFEVFADCSKCVSSCRRYDDHQVKVKAYLFAALCLG